MMQTVALAAVVLFIGYGLKRRVGVLDRYNIPAPVVGGFLFTALSLGLRLGGVLNFEFDTTLQTPLMQAYASAKLAELTVALGAAFALAGIGIAARPRS